MEADLRKLILGSWLCGPQVLEIAKLCCLDTGAWVAVAVAASGMVMRGFIYSLLGEVFDSGNRFVQLLGISTELLCGYKHVLL